MATTIKVKPGVDTSEYKLAGKTTTWGIVAMILGGIVGIGTKLLEVFGPESGAGIWIGLAVSVSGAFLAAFTQAGYTSSRTTLKKEEIKAKANGSGG